MKKASAISYDKSVGVPVVLASGEGVIAENIIDIAKKKGIPINRDDNLAAILSKVKPGNSVPEEAWQKVAEIFVFLAKVDKKLGKK